MTKSFAFATSSVRAFAVWALLGGSAAAAPATRVTLPAAPFTPLYSPESTRPAAVPVAAFRLDRTPVTNGEFANFVAAHPAWSRDRAPAVFRDTGYLAQWPTAEGPAPADATLPVVNVSWFAARAYCKAAEGRLPGEMEWEYAALAGRETPDMRREPAVERDTLAWYTAPTPARLHPVGRGQANYWGLFDMHTLVWEWIDDVNASLTTGDNRTGTDKDRAQFCGGTAGGAGDRTDYASYQRYAFRSSLQAKYTGHNLGFRCAEDMPGDSLYQLDATWTTDNGKALTLGAWAGRPVVLTLLYTSCKQACPIMVEDLKRLQAALTPAERKRVAFVTVTLDPEHDTPARLAAFKAKIPAAREWTFLHGDAASVRELAAVLGIRYRWLGGEIMHTNAITLLDAEGRPAHQTLGLNAPLGDTLEPLRKLLAKP